MSSGVTRAAPARCLMVWMTISTVAVLALWVCWPDLAGLIERRPIGTFEAWLSTGASVTAALCIIWLWLVSTIAVGEAATGRIHLSITGCPLAVRLLVVAGCGLAVASGGIASPAQAGEIQIDSHQPETSARVVSGLPLPERATVAPLERSNLKEAPRAKRNVAGSPGGNGLDHPEVTPPASATEYGAEGDTSSDSATSSDRASSDIRPRSQPGLRPKQVPPIQTRGQVEWLVVAEGDSLWGLADSLTPAGPEATRSQRIAELTDGLYQANRRVIGDNPDVIRPQQRLQVPPQEEK